MKSYLSLFKSNNKYFSDSKNNYFWNLVLTLTIWYNLIYALGAISSLLFFISLLFVQAPLQAYINVLLFASIPILTILINFKVIREVININYSLLGVVLNFVCFLYLLMHPDYDYIIVKILVLAGPIINILILLKIFKDTKSNRKNKFINA